MARMTTEQLAEWDEATKLIPESLTIELTSDTLVAAGHELTTLRAVAKAAMRYRDALLADDDWSGDGSTWVDPEEAVNALDVALVAAGLPKEAGR